MSVMVWGHRGHRHHRTGEDQPYENSMTAYRHALQHVMGIECDVVQSKDKTPYLVHDTLFDGIVKYELTHHLDEASRQTVGGRFIFDMHDTEIEALHLKDGQLVPRLSKLLQLLSEYPDRVVNLELKGPDVTDAALYAVEHAIHHKRISREQVVFSSFNFPALRSLRLDTGTRFKISVSFMPEGYPAAQMYPNWPFAEQNAYYLPFSVETLQRPDLIDINPDFFNLEYRSLNVETIEAIHFFYPKAKIIVWTAGEAYPGPQSPLVQAIKTYVSSGKIHAVISDYPAALRQMLDD